MKGDSRRSDWQKRDSQRRRAAEEKYERAEIAKMKAGIQHKESGVTKPGYNFSLGKYIGSHAEFKKEWKEYKKTHPDSELAHDTK